MVTGYLEDLERRIDESVEEDLLEQWHAFWEGGCSETIFSPRRRDVSDAGKKWPAVRVNQAIENEEAMLLQQYGSCVDILVRGGGAIMNVRANYGVGILPRVFGAPLFMMDDEMNTLPNVESLGGEDKLLAMLDAGMPDLDTGFGASVFRMGQWYAAIAEQYPKIGRYVHIYHPDLQGPMDVCELLWGSEIFLAFFDKPDLIHQCLELIVETYIAFMRKWESIVPFRDVYNAHWGLLMKGKIVIRDDSAMNLSPEMFQEFIAPYNERLFREFGGGMDHFCGRGDHFVPHLVNIDGLNAINLSQPEYNDMPSIIRSAADSGVKILGLQRAAAEEALAAGVDLQGCVHCP